MRWEDESYVRLYKRETPEWTLLCWQARVLHPLILKNLDRAGLLELGSNRWEALASALRVPLNFVESAMNGTSEFKGLLANGCLTLVPDGNGGELLHARNFIKAQEARQSDSRRKKTEREGASARAKAASLGLVDHNSSDEAVTNCDIDPNGAGAHVTKCDVPVTKRDIDSDEAVTNCDIDPNRQEGRVAPAPVTLCDGPVTNRDSSSQIVTKCHTESHGVTRCHSVLCFALLCSESEEKIQYSKNCSEHLSTETQSETGANAPGGMCDSKSKNPTHPTPEPLLLTPALPTPNAKQIVYQEITAVIEHWIAQPYHPGRVKITSERRKRVQARIDEGFTADEL